VAPSTDILIGDPNAQHVLIRPLSRRHPDLFDYADANSIDCEVEIVAGGFQGTFRADLRSEEFQSFLDEIEGSIRAQEGAAALTTMEGQVTVAIADGDAQSRGTDSALMRVSGDGCDAPGAGNRLRFAFDMERAQLPAIAQALKYLLSAYPVTGAVET
jgi:hypothetical protein